MEIQLQELIDQIKKDGVQAAEEQASAILESANEEAKKILSDAKREAEAILQKAKQENERLVRVSEDAIRQAGRNVLISFRESVAKELEAVAGEQVTAVYSSEVFADLIAAAVQAWAQNQEAETIAVLLSKEDLAKLEGSLHAALKARMLDGVTLKASDKLDGGFRIAVSDGHVYYDYSTAAVVELLSAYLSPRVTALMKEAEGV